MVIPLDLLVLDILADDSLKSAFTGRDHSNVSKKLSHIALSQQSTMRPIEVIGLLGRSPP
ncbi:MAG: hypothetical protein CL908_23525 [Deltaproteobacteria bacterium]|nr:hypothetical protein [Deltaproteobacteria bacterium]